jgi:hypothetical protein
MWPAIVRHFPIVPPANSPLSAAGAASQEARGLLRPAPRFQFETMTLRSRVAVALLLTWVPLVILAAAGGVAMGEGVGIPLLYDYATNARFLVAMPVLIAAEGIVWSKVRALTGYLVRSGLVAASDEPILERLVQRFSVLRRSRVITVAAAIGVVFGVIFLRKVYSGDRSTWEFVAGSSGQIRSAAGWWNLLISVPVFQFLLLFWVWRYIAWCWFLFRLSRLDLVLLPSHPDRAAGLRPIAQVHQYWAIVVFAMSSLLSAHVGLEIVKGGRVLTDFRLEIAAFLGLSLIVLLAPFLAFSGRLQAARSRGLIDYGLLAAEYTRAFDAKWMGRASAEHELLGSADIQSLADLANSYQVVHGLRYVPFELLNVFMIVLSVALPFVPLVFTRFSPIEVAREMIQILL